MAFATASGGPASMVGFDLARSFTPVQAIGRANGLVNVGGFTASLLTMALIGIVLDLVEPGGMDAYTLDDFRLAMSVQYLFWALRDRADPALPTARPRPPARACTRARSSRCGPAEPFVHPGIGDRGRLTLAIRDAVTSEPGGAVGRRTSVEGSTSMRRPRVGVQVARRIGRARVLEVVHRRPAGPATTTSCQPASVVASRTIRAVL